VPALSAVGLLAGTWWAGCRLFNRVVASLGAAMLALLPATFALSAYAILDMTFTALLFWGLSLIAVSALRERPRLQYGGYVLVALAVLTKGPLALVLAALAFAIVLVVAPAARRPLLRLHWPLGLCAILITASPWFLYMWWRFGQAFIDGYIFHENLSLYARPVFGPAAPKTYYFSIVTVGLLPWTPLLAGRLIDLARGTHASTEERLLWAWILAVVGFFSLSHFKLDHYVYPIAPAACVLAAHAWHELRTTASLRPHAALAAGALASAVTLVAGGIALIQVVNRLPVELKPWISLVPPAFIASGVLLLVRLWVGRLRPPAFPAGVVAALLLAYSLIVVVVLPEFERAKPIKNLALWVETNTSSTQTVAAYRLDRWNTSWRFYVNRPVEFLETREQVVDFFNRPGRRVCIMLRSDLDTLAKEGVQLPIVLERPGLFTTSGRAIQRNGQANWKTFVVVAIASPQQDKS